MAVRDAQHAVPPSHRLPLLRFFRIESVYEQEGDAHRAAAVSAISMAFGLMALVASVIMRAALGIDWGPVLINGAVGVGFLVMVAAARRGRLRFAGMGFVLLALFFPMAQAAWFDLMSVEIAAVAFVVPIFASSFLLGARWGFGTAFVASLLTAGAIYVERIGSTAALSEALRSFDAASPVLVIVEAVFLLHVVGVLSWLVSTSVISWAAQAERQAAQLEAAVVVSETAATASSLRDLLNDVVERIRQVYGFYHAQVFLLDEEGRMARLEASTGRAGEALLARGHALAVGSQSIIGMCTASGQPVVVNDVRTSSIHRPNELLPDTRAELALPLRVGEQVIGAIDVQSTYAHAFQPADVRSLSVMAAQLAAAIDKARLVDELQARAAENQQLFDESQAALRQLDELNRRLTREGWGEYLRSRRQEVLGFSLHGEQIVEDERWTPTMLAAYQSEGGPVVRRDGDRYVAALPLRLRGEVIGVLELGREGPRGWTRAELELAQTLVDRLTTAIENARLYERARQATERERVVNQIGQDVQAARSIDEVLQSALAELSEVLGATHGVVQIRPGQQAARSAEPAPTTSLEA